jgi:signal peptidase I
VKRTRLRSSLLTAAILTLAALAWLDLAPTQIGGSTSYVTTHGISMEPRFHAGDLAIVRPADHYDVGEIVAYHSTLLHVVVLHRIIARDGNRYLFKGDNNKFIDPTHPSRDQLIGAMWLHVPRGGLALAVLHTPLIAAVVVAVLALLLLAVGAEEQRRRRNHRRTGATGAGGQGPHHVNPRDHGAGRHHDYRALLIACAVAVAAFLGLGLVAFRRPVDKPATIKIPYTQGMRFGYHARAPAGPVYPSGVLNTGDPIFLTLVHRVRVQINYRLATGAAHRLAGTEAVLVRVTGPGGWSRSIPVGAPERFTGDHVSTQVTLDLPYLQSLIARIQTLTGVSAGGAYAVAVAPQVQISGTVAGQPIKANFDPVLSFQVNPLQLTPGGGSTTTGASQTGLTPIQRGTVATPSTAPNPLRVLGHALAVTTLRWVALVGFLLASASTLVLAVLLKLSHPFGEAARIQAQYGHLIVPIAGGIDDMWTPFDVPDIKALVRLAECSERLVLHHHDDTADTYLVDDEGTMYRYKAGPTGVVWGEWSSTPPDPAVNGSGPDSSSASSPGEPAASELDPLQQGAPLLSDADGDGSEEFDAEVSTALRDSVRSISALTASHAPALGSGSQQPPPGDFPPETVIPGTSPNSAEVAPDHLT